MGCYSSAKQWLIRVLKWSLIVGCGLDAQVWAHSFHAPLDVAQWEVDSSQFRCVLSHTIVGYGVVRFVSTSREVLRFEVEPKDVPTQKGKALIAIRGPEWKSGVKSRQIDAVTFTLNERPVVVHGDTPQRLLSELSAGMSPIVEHPGLYPGHPTQVEILPVRLWPALRKFRSCQTRLMEDSILRAKRLNVNFAFDSYQLDTKARQQLDKLVELLSLSADRYELLVRGHTDNRGDYDYNDGLSHKRALAVKTYLDLKQAPRSTLELKYFGEVEPLVSNDTADHRLLNRRVEVVLQAYDDVHKSIEQAVAKVDMPVSYQPIVSPGEVTSASSSQQNQKPVRAGVEVEPTLFDDMQDLSGNAPTTNDAPVKNQASGDDKVAPSKTDAEVVDQADSQLALEGAGETPLKPIPYEESKGQSREPIPGKIWAR